MRAPVLVPVPELLSLDMQAADRMYYIFQALCDCQEALAEKNVDATVTEVLLVAALLIPTGALIMNI